MQMTRRRFLHRSSAAALAFGGLRHFLLTPSGYADTSTNQEIAGYGELIPDPDGICDLPKGFDYRLISPVGEEMDDGLKVPGLHDGMAAFAGSQGKTILVRNHELNPSDLEYSPYGAKQERFSHVDRSKLYDAGGGKSPGLGGTTTLVYDTREKRLEKHFLSLAGTMRNCAGGPAPWNSWLSCEETVQRAEGDFEKDHGYVFEVPVTEEVRLADPVPLKAMGRFNHEAVAVDPRSGIVYLTEDRHEGLFYRFLPEKPGELSAGGRLQALKVRDTFGLDSRNWNQSVFPVGHRVAVEWVDLEEVEAPRDDLRYRGFFDLGAARFARGEGIWYEDGEIYIACTNGGRNQKGQVFRYVPGAAEGRQGESSQPGRLELFIEPNDAALVENADNLTMAPWGDLIICEDGGTPESLVGVTPEGRIYRLARTSISELAGATFSPDGSTLFVNIQRPGRTLAITGPWENRKDSV
jgi:secreted PhoX family phosphatase